MKVIIAEAFRSLEIMV